jgi:hypothetical protein
VKITSWNIAGQTTCWREFQASGVDIALLLEATEPPAGIADRINPVTFRTAGEKRLPWRATVAHLSDHVGVEWLEAKPTSKTIPGTLCRLASRPGRRP